MSLVLVHIGAMKAASTWLHTWLLRHPLLAAPWPSLDRIAPGKNPYFWNDGHPYGRPERLLERAIPIRDLQHYRELADSRPKTFDLTDSYSYMTPAMIRALKSAFPGVAISYIIRDPVETVWAHMAAHRWTVDDLRHEPRALENVRYGQNLGRWHAAGFDPLVMHFDDLRRDPLGVLERMARLLDIDPAPWRIREPEIRQRINARHNPGPIVPEVRERILELLEES